jgi:hypothetical protein
MVNYENFFEKEYSKIFKDYTKETFEEFDCFPGCQ